MARDTIALLLFLHLAADRTDCSFWADATIAKTLGLREGDVIRARCRLVAKGLVAYRYPLYQLLPLADTSMTGVLELPVARLAPRWRLSMLQKTSSQNRS